MKYFRKVVGEKCFLSPISLDDAERYTEWINDMEVGQFLLISSSVIDLEQEKEILKHLIRDNTIFAIVEKDTGKAIGICGLHDVNSTHRRATLGIFIGDKSYWNQGIGTEATSLIVDFGFNIMNLHHITLEVVDYNLRAIRCYEKTGFQFVGRKRSCMYMAGNYHDLLVYDILASDFSNSYIKKVFDRSTSEDPNLNKITFI